MFKKDIELLAFPSSLWIHFRSSESFQAGRHSAYIIAFIGRTLLIIFVIYPELPARFFLMCPFILLLTILDLIIIVRCFLLF